MRRVVWLLSWLVCHIESKMVVLYCDKCGWFSDPDVGIKNQCPFCRNPAESLRWVSGTKDEVDMWLIALINSGVRR